MAIDEHPQPSTALVRRAPEVPALGDDVRLQLLWLGLQQRSWRSLAVIAASEGIETLTVADTLAKIAWAYTGQPTCVFDMRDLNLRLLEHQIRDMAAQLQGGERVFVALRSISENPTAVPLAMAADAVVALHRAGADRHQGRAADASRRSGPREVPRHPPGASRDVQGHLGPSASGRTPEMSDEPRASSLRVRIGGLPIDRLTLDGAIAAVDELVSSGRGGAVFTPNVDHVVEYQDNSRLREAYEAASLSLVDGVPVLWASHLLGAPLPEKVSGSDLVMPLLRHAAKRGWRVFLLGGAATAWQFEMAKGSLEEFDPGHTTSKSEHSPLRIDMRQEGAARGAGRRAPSRRSREARSLIVALRCAKSRKLFIHETREALRPAGLCSGLGASLDFIRCRAPLFSRADWHCPVYAGCRGVASGGSFACRAGPGASGAAPTWCAIRRVLPAHLLCSRAACATPGRDLRRGRGSKGQRITRGVGWTTWMGRKTTWSSRE